MTKFIIKETGKVKIVIIIGARPQFIKASAICRAIRENYSELIDQVIINTGQHYDDNMSAVFFDELDLPFVKYVFNAGSGEHGAQTARMLNNIEKVLLSEKPHYVLVFGDTNTTLAGALAASKLGIKLIHVEAGLRSFNKNMPEEINRILTDHVSTLLFTPTLKGVENLLREGFKTNTKPPYSPDHPAVIHCGDIMYDNTLYFSKLANQKSDILKRLELKSEEYLLLTLHRNTNTDDPERLTSIFKAIDRISLQHKCRIVFPIHPRTQKKWDQLHDEVLKQKIADNTLLTIIPAVSYIDFISLEKNALMIITDSGGVQKEAYFFEKKCLIIREETEWVELVDLGMARACGVEEDKIVKAFDSLSKKIDLHYPKIYGDGKAAEFIIKKILELH
jgi:UDP-GlcNAc3NAcA epimerase